MVIIVIMENPAAYIPLDRRHALARQERLPSVTNGAVLFADISGFTPLTEALVRCYGPRRGADELTRQLNQIYGDLIGHVHQFGGSVIGFSGDAITCWFAGELHQSVRQALAAAQAMQRATTMFPVTALPDGTTPTIAVKTALAAGPVRRFLVGDPQIQLIDVLAGATLQRVAAAEQIAGRGEIVIDGDSAILLSPLPPGMWRSHGDASFFVMDGAVELPYQPVAVRPVFPDLPDDVCRAWILPALFERMAGEQGRFLAELRPAVSLFLAFDGIDYECDPDAGARLDQFVRRAQRIVHNLEGVLLQLTIGDKGSYFYAAFGAPIAHDDDRRRAVAAALELRKLPAEIATIGSVRIGISQGRMRAGAYGSETRRTYGVLGDEVNLAARLMGRADTGQILVSPQVAQAVTRHYKLQSRGSVILKGKSEPLFVFTVEGEQVRSEYPFTPQFVEPLVGREAELAQLLQAIIQTQAGQGQMLRLIGDAGIGKSHLAAVAAARAQEQALDVIVATCHSPDQNRAYAAASQFMRQLLNIPSESDPSAQIERLAGALHSMNDGWTVRLPLLGDLLGLSIPDNGATAAFTPQVRQEALIALVVEIVRAQARQRPMLILFEDVHWIDEASQRLLLALARVLEDVSLLLLLVQRPLTGVDNGFERELTGLPSQLVIHLDELDEEGVQALIQQRLGGAVSPLALSFVGMQAQGNPFFIEELVDALRESSDLILQDGVWTLAAAMVVALHEADCLTQDEGGQWRLVDDASLASVSTGLPDSIHGLVLSRLDRLPEPAKLTLKVASVIGRIFDLDLLIHSHPLSLDEPTLTNQLDVIHGRDFVRLERSRPRPVYTFKHNITQEVVYRTLLESQQQDLHVTVAGRLEQIQPAAVEQLAYHYYLGDLSLPMVRQKAMDYVGAAGQKAKREYANETALAYLNRALGLAVRWEWLAAKAEVLHILGRRDEERETLRKLAELGQAPAFQVHFRWGDYYEAISDYPQAETAIEQALTAARLDGDGRGQLQTLARLGVIAWRRGDYDAAAVAYERALALRTGETGYEQEEAEVHYGWGLLHRERSDYHQSSIEFQRALQLNRQIGDQYSEARTLSALAGVLFFEGRDYAETASYVRQALQIRRRIGDRAGEGASLLNLAQVISRLGDYGEAESLLQQALVIQQALGNRWWETIVWNELGAVYWTIGCFEKAEVALKTALSLCRSIGTDYLLVSILGNWAQVQGERGNLEAAEQAFLEGYQIAQAQAEKFHQAQYQSDWALLRLKQANYLEAIAKAEEASALFAQIEMERAQPACLSVLGLCHLALGDMANALTYATTLFDYLEQRADFNLDFPHHGYLACYRVFSAAGDTVRARQSLEQAYLQLMHRADKISNPELRHSFLHSVPYNRQIMALAGDVLAVEREVIA